MEITIRLVDARSHGIKEPEWEGPGWYITVKQPDLMVQTNSYSVPPTLLRAKWVIESMKILAGAFAGGPMEHIAEQTFSATRALAKRYEDNAEDMKVRAADMIRTTKANLTP